MGRVRHKLCDRCHQAAPVLYRVQWDDTGVWHFICDACYPALRHQHPDYTYGGTWKAKKRKN
jgi:hypothetical protein